MKEELQEKLVDILTSIQTTTAKATDFAIEQLPDIAQSYVLYGRVYTTFCVVFAVLSIGLCVWIGSRFCKATDGRSWSFALLGSVLPVMIIFENFSGMMLVWFAPKVWLLKELAQFVK